MKRLLILGAGGHGKVVADAAQASGDWGEVNFLDDRVASGSTVMGLQVVGDISALGQLVDRFTHAIVAVGDSARRLELIERLRVEGYSVAVVVHPRAWVSPFATLAAGTVVMAGAIINPDTKVGIGGIINTGACVDHDCQLGDGVHVCPGVSLAGNVAVGDRTWIGIGACAKQGVRIGRDVMVGAGATVISDVSDGLTVVGTPARPIVRSASRV